VLAVATESHQYWLFEGWYPNGQSGSNWVGSDYIDSVAELIGHAILE
jgi:hypothetical protein